MVSYEVKHDTLHRVWHRLSVATKQCMSEHEMSLYAEQWAVDNQANPHMVAIRAVECGNVVAIHLSDAFENRPK